MKTILGPTDAKVVKREEAPIHDPVIDALYRPRPRFVTYLETEVRHRLLGAPEAESVTAVVTEIAKPDKEGEGAIPIKTRYPQKLLYGRWCCNYHVKTVASLTPDQAKRILFGTDDRGETSNHHWEFTKPTTLEATLTYPLSVDVKITVSPPMRVKDEEDEFPGTGGSFNSFGLFLLALAKEYERIYAEDNVDPSKYGIWGHALGDLFFEVVEVCKDGRVYVGIGS